MAIKTEGDGGQDHGPIEEKQRALMNAVAESLDELFNGKALPGLPRPKKIGFVLLTAEFGKIEKGRVNYISNGEREDMLKMMKEMIDRAEGRYKEPEPGGQPS